MHEIREAHPNRASGACARGAVFVVLAGRQCGSRLGQLFLFMSRALHGGRSDHSFVRTTNVHLECTRTRAREFYIRMCELTAHEHSHANQLVRGEARPVATHEVAERGRADACEREGCGMSLTRDVSCGRQRAMCGCTYLARARVLRLDAWAAAGLLGPAAQCAASLAPPARWFCAEQRMSVRART